MRAYPRFLGAVANSFTSPPPIQAQEAHVAIRGSLSRLFGCTEGEAGGVRVLYGGSVTPDSAGGIMSMPDVDGALVGGASLNAESFTRIFDGTTIADAGKKASS